MDSFRRNAWNLKPQGRDGNYQRYAFGNGGAAKVLDVYIDEDERPGTWALGEGQVHHAAFEVADLDVQAALKFDVEGLGYTDFSDRKHRGYFESIYVRTPGGVLFEASVTLGFTHDESPEKLGSEVKVAPQLEGVKDELLRTMNDPIVIRSEEHTSELQSLMRISYAVFCLKKKTTVKTTYVCNPQSTEILHIPD